VCDKVGLKLFWASAAIPFAVLQDLGGNEVALEKSVENPWQGLDSDCYIARNRHQNLRLSIARLDMVRGRVFFLREVQLTARTKLGPGSWE
jgi:hypothetical protein